MSQTEVIHGNSHDYEISNNGDVSHGIQYFRKYWDDQKVIDIFQFAKDADRNVGYKFEIEGKRYTLYHDGDYKYFLKAVY